MPRPTNRKTTLGAARALLGISTTQLEKRSGVAVSTIEKVESGRLALTLEVARKIGWSTAIHPRWLMDGNPNTDPVSILGGPWSAEAGAEIQRWKKNMNEADKERFRNNCRVWLEMLSDSLFPKAIKDGKIVDLLIDLDIAVTKVIEAHYPRATTREWLNETRPLRTLQSSRSARRKKQE
jgi:transcriptional regulator with XRE-family HTH domain